MKKYIMSFVFASIVATSFAGGTTPAPAPTPTPMENVGNAIVDAAVWVGTGLNTFVCWFGTYSM